MRVARGFYPAMSLLAEKRRNKFTNAVKQVTDNYCFNFSQQSVKKLLIMWHKLVLSPWPRVLGVLRLEAVTHAVTNRIKRCPVITLLPSRIQTVAVRRPVECTTGFPPPHCQLHDASLHAEPGSDSGLPYDWLRRAL